MKWFCLADDLTGGAEAAAMLGSAPTLLWCRQDAMPSHVGVGLVGTALTRECRSDEVVPRLIPWQQFLQIQQPELMILKMDSLLRGHWATEALFLQTHLQKKRVVIIPSLPDQGRISQDGVVYWHGKRLRDTEIGASIRSDCVQNYFGAKQVMVCNRPERVCEAEVVISDARTMVDIEAWVEYFAPQAADILWVGTRALITALAKYFITHKAQNRPGPVATPSLQRPTVALVGSVTEMAQRQVQYLLKQEVFSQRLEDWDLMQAISVFTSHGLTTVEMEAKFLWILQHLQPQKVGSLLLTGGETAARFLQATGASGMVIEAFLQGGATYGRFVDGSFAGKQVIMKSGSFGDETTLATLLGVV